MYCLDFALMGVIMFFGVLGFSGLLNKLSGLMFGILLGIFIVGITPTILTKYDLGIHMNPENSLILTYMKYFISYVMNSGYIR